MEAIEMGTLRELSHRVRQAFEKLYGHESFADEEFCGACAVVSWMLCELAEKQGLELSLIVAYSHAWCEDTNGNVVDATYSQYVNECPIWIGDPTLHHHYKSGVQENWDDKRKGYLGCWPDEQNPLSAKNVPILEDWLREAC